VVLVVSLFLCVFAAVGSTARGADVERVVVVFKTHFDIGYTETAANVVKRYRTEMIDQALAVCDETRDLPSQRQFVWTTPGWPMAKILEDWDGQTAARQRRVLEACREGRFVVHALPFTTHTGLLELEDLVRGMQFSSHLARRVGQPLPRDAKMTDVPCHSWIVPTLLRHAGVEFLHLGCNAASSSPEVPLLFWWEGPDGSRLLTMYSAEGYGTGLTAPPDWPHKTWLALIHTGDNHGPPRPDEVKRLLADAAEQLPGVRLQIGRLSDFADAILAEEPTLPVVRGDMPDSWIHGPMCDPQGAKLARNVRPLIAATESLNTLLRLRQPDVADVSPAVAVAYENSLLYGEHTWGGALAWITSYETVDFPYGDAWKKDRQAGRFTRLEASWNEHTGYIRKAQNEIRPVLDQQLQQLANSVAVTDRRIVVYNPLPWKRRGVVRVKTERGPLGGSLRTAGSETRIPVVSDDGVVSFVAHDVPATGYRTYVEDANHAAVPGHLDADPERHELTSPFFKVALDPQRGTIRALVDRRTERQLVDDQADYALGQFLYERFDADQIAAFVKAYVKIDTSWALNELGKPAMPPAAEVPYRATSPQTFSVRYEQTPASVTAIMTAQASRDVPTAVTLKVTLYETLPCVDLEMILHDKPADPWPEAGWICLPLRTCNKTTEAAPLQRKSGTHDHALLQAPKGSSPQFHLGRLGSIVDPARDIVRGTNRHLLAIHSGLAVTDAAGRGVGICPIDHPLVSLGVPGCWKYSKDYVPIESVVFVNLFNNQWTTNFRLWNEGTWSSRVRLWAIDGFDAARDLVTPSLEARYPLLAAAADGPGGSRAVTDRGIEVSRPGTMVTAWSVSRDGKGGVLRLWELAGRSGPCEIRLPEGLGACRQRPVDLRGQPLCEWQPIESARWTIDLGQFAPKAYQIE
jgi:alpha-mannosidase